MTRWHGSAVEQLRVVDSHTAGEPTRVVTELPPSLAQDLGRGPVEERLARLRDQHDWLRRAVVCEPRGSEVAVGALLLPPCEPNHAAGVIYFNNVGYLGMCGHGTIGVVATLRHLGRLSPGEHVIETPVGEIRTQLEPDGTVAVENVPARRTARRIAVEVPAIGAVVGDVAWGGNWFFLAHGERAKLALARIPELLREARAIREALDRSDIRGDDGGLIDHVELFGPPSTPSAHSRNFVLCPGGAYDRSPCGTGTSAKLACLAEDGLLAEGEVWVQESIVGGLFRAWYRRDAEGRVVPTISGEAFVNGEATILLDPRDPFATGIP